MTATSNPVRVLVVDDDFMVASIHRRFVGLVEGFEVIGEARTGAAALEAIESLRPNLVLLDIYLPDMSGLEVLRQVRQAGRPVDVLVVTAARDVDTVREALRGGVLQYLVKPFTAEDLAERLADYRRLHAALDRPDQIDQGELDSVFRSGRGARAGGQPLPKGLSAETLRLVADCLSRHSGDGGTQSAQECADTVGLARVSTRRYLEHLVDTGQAEVKLKYGGTGRPERRYRMLN